MQNILLSKKWSCINVGDFDGIVAGLLATNSFVMLWLLKLLVPGLDIGYMSTGKAQLSVEQLSGSAVFEARNGNICRYGVLSKTTLLVIFWFSVYSEFFGNYGHICLWLLRLYYIYRLFAAENRLKQWHREGIVPRGNVHPPLLAYSV